MVPSNLEFTKKGLSQQLTAEYNISFMNRVIHGREATLVSARFTVITITPFFIFNCTGRSYQCILEKPLSLKVTDYRRLCKHRMNLMWSSHKEGETEYCPWVGNRTMGAAQQHIIAWAISTLEAVHACQRMRDEFHDGIDSN
ncbi:uncharacterized protein FFB20_05291 [Fusarium fujikuroi]|nr:uncharacterized protein FFB20_05291 [Fusarium fujikuroi]SCN81733.1 uncharacterized protein FFE2_04736 [Fusarium fujikuroi]SCN84237.1 uncharacterized protein FFM5_03281 [Fusarium fujikuroi]SCV35000.1 uncharacterized protein FFFS_04544 [Fusarium fujikuroi]